MRRPAGATPRRAGPPDRGGAGVGRQKRRRKPGPILFADDVGQRAQVGGVDGIAVGIRQRGGIVGAARRRSGDVIGEPQDAAGPEQRRPAAAEEARGGEHSGRLAYQHS